MQCDTSEISLSGTCYKIKEIFQDGKKYSNTDLSIISQDQTVGDYQIKTQSISSATDISLSIDKTVLKIPSACVESLLNHFGTNPLNLIYAENTSTS
ncbi:MAG: hypothetical protein MJ252_18935, partial [archaeon]|nr:hypothetical protein [archaeon]